MAPRSLAAPASSSRTRSLRAPPGTRRGTAPAEAARRPPMDSARRSRTAPNARHRSNPAPHVRRNGTADHAAINAAVNQAIARPRSARHRSTPLRPARRHRPRTTAPTPHDGTDPAPSTPAPSPPLRRPRSSAPPESAQRLRTARCQRPAPRSLGQCRVVEVRPQKSSREVSAGLALGEGRAGPRRPPQRAVSGQSGRT
jgi:hypothetical protein